MKIQFQYPVYPDLTIPKGYLPKDKRAYALWYYYTLAQKLAEQLGDGSTEAQFGILEHERWMEPRYEQIARSVAMMYGFSNPEPFMQERLWQVVEEQAISMGLPSPDPRIKKPIRIVMVS